MPHLSVEFGTFLGMSVAFVILLWAGRLPSPDSFHKTLEALNSRGGNILILTTGSIYFFSHSVRIFYYLFEASKSGQIQQDNAFALMALQFATSTAFGGAFGALLKTMTGEGSKGRAGDVLSDPNGSGGPIPSVPPPNASEGQQTTATGTVGGD